MHKFNSIQKLLVKVKYNEHFEKLNLKEFMPLHIVLVRHGRKMDLSNVVGSFKYVQDQIAACITGDTRPGMADGDERLTWEYKQTKRLVPKEDSITIEVYSKRYALEKMLC